MDSISGLAVLPARRPRSWATLICFWWRYSSLGCGVSGPYFHYSDTWQLIINTGTTIITFLVVFLIQNTQNRDAKALHLKLDELIRSHHPANDDLIDIQKLSDEELDSLENATPLSARNARPGARKQRRELRQKRGLAKRKPENRKLRNPRLRNQRSPETMLDSPLSQPQEPTTKDTKEHEGSNVGSGL